MASYPLCLHETVALEHANPKTFGLLFVRQPIHGLSDRIVEGIAWSGGSGDFRPFGAALRSRLANLEPFRRIAGQMDTCFQPADPNGPELGNQPVPWRMAPIAEYNPLTRETHDTLGQDLPGILPFPEARLDLPNSRVQEEVVAARAFGGLVGQSAP